MSLESFYYLISHISSSSILVPIACCVLRFKAFNNNILKALFVYLILSLLSEVAGLNLVLNDTRNYLIQQLYTVIECSFITYIYYNIFEQVRVKRLIIGSFLIFVILASYSFILLNGLNKPDYLLSTFESCFVVSLSWGYFYKLMTEPRKMRFTTNYVFWINSGFLLYFSVGFLLFLFNDYLENCPVSIFYFLWGLNLLSNITCNIFLSIAILKINRKWESL